MSTKQKLHDKNTLSLAPSFLLLGKKIGSWKLTREKILDWLLLINGNTPRLTHHTIIHFYFLGSNEHFFFRLKRFLFPQKRIEDSVMILHVMMWCNQRHSYSHSSESHWDASWEWCSKIVLRSVYLECWSYQCMLTLALQFLLMQHLL